MMAEGKLDELIDKLMERMERENYISAVPAEWAHAHRRGERAGGQRGGPGSRERPFRGDRQEPGLSGLQDAARSDGVAGQIELRTPRHAALGHGHRDQRRVAAVRVRRHAESGHHGDAELGDCARGAGAAAEPGIRRSACAPVRLPELVRDGGDAGLLALDDSVRRGPVYAGQARGHGALAPDPHAVSGRFAVAGAVSRFGGGDAGRRNWRG